MPRYVGYTGRPWASRPICEVRSLRMRPYGRLISRKRCSKFHKRYLCVCPFMRDEYNAFGHASDLIIATCSSLFNSSLIDCLSLSFSLSLSLKHSCKCYLCVYSCVCVSFSTNLTAMNIICFADIRVCYIHNTNRIASLLFIFEALNETSFTRHMMLGYKLRSY